MRSTSAELIDDTLALMPDAAVVVDQDGVITHANEALSGLFGYELGALLGEHIEVLVPERLRSVHRRLRSGFISDPRPRPMGAGLRLSGRRSDGAEFPVDISLAPLVLSGERSVVASMRDVSDRVKAEAAMAQLAAIVEGSNDVIFALGVDGLIESWNPGACRTLGFASAEVIGRHVSLLFAGASSVEFEDQLGAAMQGRVVAAQDMTLRTQAGEEIPVALVISPLQANAASTTGFSVVARDVTERKRSEAELRRLLSEGARNARWQEITAEVRLRILDEADLDDVLSLSCDRLGELIDAKGVAVVVGEHNRIGAVSGLAGDVVGTLDGAALPVLDGDLPEVRRAVTLDPVLAERVRGLNVLVVPIGAGGDRVGRLLCFLDDDPDAATVTMAMSFAEQVALAIELDHAKSERDILLIGDERGRIARDLHDLVIQRLFASGLSLQSVVPLVRDERAATRLAEVVDELDATIREIRTTIFTLAPPAHTSSGLRARVLEVVDESTRLLGFEATTRFRGPVDSVVGSDVMAHHVLAVVREGLANVARHAQAHSARIEVGATPDRIEVSIIDDGVGISELRRESGLRNLRQRAEDLGGSLQIEVAEPSGTVLRWQIPLAALALVP